MVNESSKKVQKNKREVQIRGKVQKVVNEALKNAELSGIEALKVLNKQKKTV